MTSPFALAARAEVSALVAFADLTGFAAQSTRVTDPELAETMDALYQLVGARVRAAGGRVVKFIGDAALLLFPEAGADRGVLALLELKAAADALLAERGWPCRMTVKAHFGELVAGPFADGEGGQRFDVLGKAVNTAAMLDATGVALSAEAFRKLRPETRKHFKKHTWPVTYIRQEDPHRFRRR